MLPLLNTMEAPARSSKQQHQLMRTVSISVLVMSLPVLYVSFLHVPPAALFRDTTFWFLMSNSIIIVIAADSGMLFFRSADADAADGLSSFAVSGGEPVVTAIVKNNGHASLMMGVCASVSDEAAEAVENQALVVRDRGDLAAIGENGSGDHAYTLVERREGHGDRAVATTPETREITAGPSANVGAIVTATTTAPARRLTANRSLAAREERRRQRHAGHRPSHSHSHALVPVQDKSVVVSNERHLRRAATTDSRPPPPPEEETETETEYSRLSDEELNRRVEEFIARFNREIRLQLEKEEQAAMSAA